MAYSAMEPTDGGPYLLQSICFPLCLILSSSDYRSQTVDSVTEENVRAFLCLACHLHQRRSIVYPYIGGSTREISSFLFPFYCTCARFSKLYPGSNITLSHVFYIKAPIILDWHRPDYQYLGRQALWDVDQSRQRDAGCVQVYANIEVSRTKVRVDLYRASQHPAYVIGRISGLKVVRRGSHPVRSLSVLLQQNMGLTCVFTVVS